jgi:Domain of unknown function (DUF3883)
VRARPAEGMGVSYETLPVARSLAKALRQALRADQRTRGLTPPRFPGPVASDTGGHYVSIADLTRLIDVELWLDLYSGLPSPRAWVGFGSTSRARFRQLEGMASSAGPGDTVIRRFTRDTHYRNGISQFKHPLLSHEFDVPVLERYQYDFYLGLYMPYEWPLSRKSECAIVHESVNFVAAITLAYEAAASSKRRTVGPWNRPDKAAEQAAVRFVKARLRRDGYKVISRENEICGYDLDATRNGSTLHVEVKGVSGDSPRFHITSNELKRAEEDPDWRLAVVLQAHTRPRMDAYIPGKQVRRLFHLKPTQWFVTGRGE